MITTKHDYSNVVIPADNFFDTDWLQGTFMLSDEEALANKGTSEEEAGEYAKWIRLNRYASTADMKFTSTSPGMSLSVNPKSQFTRYADIRNPGKLFSRPRRITTETTGHNHGLGLGRYYSEAIDDNQQRIYLRFGTPQNMSLLIWLASSFDVHKAALQNRGFITSAILEAINVGTKVFAIMAAPMLFAGKLLLEAILQPNQFVSVRDNMHVYWATVETLLNSFVTRRTMVPFFNSEEADEIDATTDDKKGFIARGIEATVGLGDGISDAMINSVTSMQESADNRINQELRPTKGFIQAMNELIPNVIDPQTGRIRVTAIALRAQSAYNRMLQDDIRRNDDINLSKDFTGYPITGEQSHDTYFTDREGGEKLWVKHLFRRFSKAWITEGEQDKPPKMTSSNPMYTDEEGKDLNPANAQKQQPESIDGERSGTADGSEDEDVAVQEQFNENLRRKKSEIDGYGDFMAANLSAGSSFAVFNVNNTGSIGESFSSSVGSNPIESVFNSISSKARSMTSNLSMVGSAIPLLGDAMSFLGDAAAITISNATFGLANPLLALAYGATISLPKQWESSSVNLAKGSYSIKLSSPYGNAYSQLFKIYLPLSMLMAGAMPRKTGLNTHTSPFLCQLYDRGRLNVPLGIIDSFSITRGTSNLSFTRSGHPNAIDVDFSITDLNESLAVDITSSSLLTRVVEAFNPNLSNDALTNYVNTVVGMDVYSMHYQLPSIRLKLAERAMTLKTLTSPDASELASMTVGAIPIFPGLVRAFGDNNAAASFDRLKGR